MALAPLPPWLNVQPSQFVDAARAGTAAGLEASQQRQRAQEAAAARAARQWEFEQELRRRALEQAAAREDSARQLAATERYNLARLGQDKSANEAQAAHWRTIEAADMARAGQSIMPTEFNRDPNKAYITAGGSYIKPTPTAKIPTISGDAAYWSALRKVELDDDLKPYQKDEAAFRLGVLRDAQKREREPLPTALASAKPAPFKEGALIRSKKDGKLYRVVNGVPVLEE
jgi:hypothetical protein